MIALPTEFPFIRVSRGNLAKCEPSWLQETLRRAASAADMPAWLAEDVSKGVEAYLRHHYPGTVIEMSELFERIRSTLASLGLEDLAAHIAEIPPPVKISLSHLARRAGPGYELAFFQLLKDQVRSAADGGTRYLLCYGLRPCVKRLATTEKWSPRCRRLEAEIKAFLEHEHRLLGQGARELALAID